MVSASKPTLSVLALCVLSLSVQASIQSTKPDSDATAYYIAGVKGFYYGYEDGFYKEKKEIKNGCMNEQTLENVEGIFTFISSPDFSNLVPLFSKAMQIFTNFQQCATESPLTDIYSFCMSSKKDTCTV